VAVIAMSSLKAIDPLALGVRGEFRTQGDCRWLLVTAAFSPRSKTA
jgi:hypothetical protein